ncbi:sugar phosphate nucleotidyltransferase [Alphaproteobacteria bacterium]|nr:sugar phosphate nucleotidyltransferase [Alphaproteobacteria bacterium]
MSEYKTLNQDENEDLVILLGGLGSRLRSVVKDVPKPMALINNKPFLKYILDYWSQIGIKRFHLLTGYKSEIIENYFGHTFQNKDILYYKDQVPLGTGGALKKFINNIPENFDKKSILILNGDTWLEVNKVKLFKKIQEYQDKILIAVRSVDFNDRYASFSLIEDQINEINLPNKTKSIINAGLYSVKISNLKEKMKHIRHKNFSFEEIVFPIFLEKNDMIASKCIEKFIDIGIPSDYEKAINYLTTKYN